jgi:hypothetical protein
MQWFVTCFNEKGCGTAVKSRKRENQFRVDGEKEKVSTKVLNSSEERQSM